MALKRTRKLGWTKANSAHQRMVANLSRRGDIDGANKLNEFNKEQHAARVRTILRNARH
jgi:hypothetical protein